MGKRISQKSLKISKNDQRTKQLNSLIKVLRPKVYITDNSNFKSLVQELTGNGTTNYISSSPVLPLTGDDKNATLLDLQVELPETPIESSKDASHSSIYGSSLDASVDSSLEFYNQQQQYSNFPEDMLNQSFYQMCSDAAYATSDHLLINPQEDMLTCQELESLLSDVDQYPDLCCNTSYSHMQPKQPMNIFEHAL